MMLLLSLLTKLRNKLFADIQEFDMFGEVPTRSCWFFHKWRYPKNPLIAPFCTEGEIKWAIAGQYCTKCKQRRVYAGPTKGWELIG